LDEVFITSFSALAAMQSLQELLWFVGIAVHKEETLLSRLFFVNSYPILLLLPKVLLLLIQHSELDLIWFCSSIYNDFIS